MPEQPPETPRRVPLRAGRKRVEVFDEEESKQQVPGTVWWACGALAAFVLVYFVVVPGYTGLQVYRAMQDAGVPESYATDMAALQQAKTDAESQAQSAFAASAESERQRQAAQVQLAACIADSARATEEADKLVESLGKDLGGAKQALAACTEQAQSLDAIIADAARRICCVQRVDNPAINAFVISDNKIACVADGGTPISC